MLYLYGDSILDNAPYVAPGDAVIDQLRRRIGPTVMLCARDGALVRDVMVQIARQRPGDDDVAVLSVGGNDLLNIADRVMMTPIADFAPIVDVLQQLNDNYQHLVTRLVATYQHVVLCTVYIPPDLAQLFEPGSDMTLALRAIRYHNHLVAETAQRYGTHLLDIANVCTEPTDFVHVIEPSARGGAKLVDALIQFPFVKPSE